MAVEFPGWLSGRVREAGGRIPVEEFMRWALYDPENGYYSRNVRTVGARGDFSTAATLGGVLGEAVARWRSRRCLIEVGAGDGSLAEAVLGVIGWVRRRVGRVSYHIVETSEPLAAKQRERLGRFGRSVTWHREMRDALGACAGEADIFCNELVDAFPASVLRWDAARRGWDEVCVGESGQESVRPAGEEPAWRWQPPVDGQRVEWHRSYREWLSGWVSHWRAGRMLTIDYGGTAEDIYRRRPEGSLRGYFAQQRVVGAEVYGRAGRQDLTCDVNVDDLQRWGDELGVETVRLESQRSFLRRTVPGVAERAVRDPALAFVLDPAGAGEAFFVLEQRRSSGRVPAPDAAR